MLGTSKQRQGTRPPERADELADLVLKDHSGADVPLGDLWREQPALLVFLRHYGWVFCREQAVQLHRHREEIEAAGVRLAVIGQGTTEHAAGFQRSQKVDIPLLVDLERESYRAAGTKVATFSELLGPGVVSRGLRRGLASGVRQGKTVGHPAQLGGTLIVAPDGSIPYAHLSEDASDHPPLEEVLQAARRAAAPA